MKILLLGADGQLGFELCRSLMPLGSLLLATRRGQLLGGIECLRADLTDLDGLRTLLESQRPDWIVNAAAYTAVDRAEEERELAQSINGKALAAIGEVAQRINARVVHYSTDYVFSGVAERPWREDDFTAPLGVYGMSKLAGERALHDSGATHLILRTAWVYSTRGNNFLRTMLRLAGEREHLQVVSDQIGTPTTSAFIALVTAMMIAQLRDVSDQDARFGTYHLTASGHTSWHGFASEIVAMAKLAKLIEHMPEVAAIASVDFPTKARRPAFSVLDTQKLQMTFSVFLPNWRHGLQSIISALADERSRCLPK